MKKIQIAVSLACGLVSASVAASASKIAFDASGAEHYNGATLALTGEKALGDDFRIVLKGDKKVDTAWHMASEKIAVVPGSAYAVFDFDIYSDADWRGSSLNSAGYSCGLKWYGEGDAVVRAPTWVDALGVKHDAESFHPRFLPKKAAHFRLVCDVPEKARFVTLGFGRDDPNVLPGERVSVSHSTVAFLAKGTPRPKPVFPDLKGPVVTRAFSSPNPDPHTAVKFRIGDETAVDWNSLRILASPSGAQTHPFEREGDLVTVAPGKAWAAGDHHLWISVKDTLGNATTVAKAFRIGAKSSEPRTRLREDGVLLVGGTPTFPIGLFGISPREANLYSLDRAFSDLKAAGVNLAHSYTHYRTPEFAAGCAKHSIISFQAEYWAAGGSKWFENTARQDPSVGLWYVGDDTAMHYEPEVIANRVEALEALDGTRLTCHADVYGSRFGEYADLVDVFMPEIYPIFGIPEDRMCVAKTIDSMERSLADIRLRSTGKPRAVWPIIQYFKGYNSWKRMPTPAEVEAMSFAAIIHGAKGITWYTYGGFVEPEKKRFNYGVCSSAETWKTTTNLIGRISALSPVLLSGDVAQPAPPEVVSGPALDLLKRPSVSALVKIQGGHRYLFAVNATDRPVRARLHTGLTEETAGTVLYSPRRVTSRAGSFEDDFKPFAVHIYRF